MALVGYDWDCVPGRWLIYTLLLAMPFPAFAVRPEPNILSGTAPLSVSARGLCQSATCVACWQQYQCSLMRSALCQTRRLLGGCSTAPFCRGMLYARLQSRGAVGNLNLLRAVTIIRPIRLGVRASAAACARLALLAEDTPADDGAGSTSGSLAPSSDSEP